MKVDSNVSAPTKFVQVGNERYAYRRFGSSGSGLPLLAFRAWDSEMF
jgi:hypothetical protein